jgi:hypothetical protein
LSSTAPSWRREGRSPRTDAAAQTAQHGPLGIGPQAPSRRRGAAARGALPGAARHRRVADAGPDGRTLMVAGRAGGRPGRWRRRGRRVSRSMRTPGLNTVVKTSGQIKGVKSGGQRLKTGGQNRWTTWQNRWSPSNQVVNTGGAENSRQDAAKCTVATTPELHEVSLERRSDPLEFPK